MLKLSIIIPVYNVELYIERCLRSCASQDLMPDEYEIIIINDGTKDKSLEIAERVASDYSNMIIYSQKNAGLSAARNKGLSMARGKYVWFVDSDDWIEKDSLKNVLINVENYDVLAMGYILAYEDEALNTTFNYAEKNLRTTKQLLLKNFVPQAQMYVFRRDFLVEEKLLFYEGIFHEDVEFTPRMLYQGGALNILEKPVYYFYQRMNSITTTPNPKRAYDLIKVVVSLIEYSSKIESEYKKVIYYRASMSINNALFISNFMSEIEKNKFNSHMYKFRYVFKVLFKAGKLKYFFEGLIFLILPRYTIQVYNIIQKFNRYAPKPASL